MKHTSSFLLLYSLAGGLLFTALFWQERFAVNMLIYSLYIVGLHYLNPHIPKNLHFKIFGAAHLLAAGLVIVNNSGLTLCAYYISMLAFVGFSHYGRLRTVFAAIISAVLQMITLPVNFLLSLSTVHIGGVSLKPAVKFMRYLLIPTIIVVFFMILYSTANDVFAHYLQSAAIQLSDWGTATFKFFFKNFDIKRLFHFCLGAILTGGLLYTFFSGLPEKIETAYTEDLKRIRKISGRKGLVYDLTEALIGNLLNKKLALKTEYIIGVISFIALNLLLLVVNAIDIVTLWFGYVPSGNFSADLHQGTNALIFSIVMAMVVILYFFRGNLNFYSKNRTLRLLAFAWMVQNLILIASVIVRDWYYIDFYGLTYKRIGVLVFTLLCIIGLASVYIKVARQKSLFYLFKINGHIWFALLLVFSAVNWDVFIARYNINKAETITLDPHYLLSLSDKTLPVLDENRTRLMNRPGRFTEGGLPYFSPNEEELQKQLDERIRYFKNRYRSVSWLSWNLQDWNTALHFKVSDKD